MRHQATRALYGYWNGLRGGRAAPERGEIDPTAIRDVIADTFMLDIDPANRYPVRLAGTRVNALFDAEQKGRSFLDLWRAAERRNVAAVLMTVADGACPVVAGGAAAPLAQGEPCSYEFLFLPLRHNGKTHARILGIVTALRQPTWLGLLPPGPLALRSLRIVEEAPRGLRAALRPREDFSVDAELAARGSLLVGSSQAGPSHAGPNRAPRPALRLIHGGLSA